MFHGGGFYLLGVQLLGLVTIGCWSALTTFLSLLVIDKTLGIRVSIEEEILGADLVEHGIKGENLIEQLQISLRTEMDKQKLRDVFEEMLTNIFSRRHTEGGHVYAHHLFPSRIQTRQPSPRGNTTDVAGGHRSSLFSLSGVAAVDPPILNSRAAWKSPETKESDGTGLTLWQQLKAQVRPMVKSPAIQPEVQLSTEPTPIGDGTVLVPQQSRREILRRSSNSTSNSPRWTLVESPECLIPLSPSPSPSR